jgi:hypothetical protein
MTSARSSVDPGVVELPDAVAGALATAQWRPTAAKTELRARRWTVGRLLAGATIFVLSEEAEGYRTVQVHGGAIEIPNGVRLMALDAQLAECPKAP